MVGVAVGRGTIARGEGLFGTQEVGGGGHAYEDVSRAPDYEVGRGFWCGSA